MARINVPLYILLFILTLGTSLTGLIMISLNAHQKCHIVVYHENTGDDDSSVSYKSCPDTLEFECPHIYSALVKSPDANPIAIHCPWYKRDLGLALSALAIAIIFNITMFVLRVRDDDSNYLIRFFGVIVFAILLASAIVLFVDLYDADLPAKTVQDNVTTTFGRTDYLVPAIMTALTCCFAVILTLIECRVKAEY